MDMETKIADTHIGFHVSCEKKHGHLIRLILTLCTEKNTGLPRILAFYAATCGHNVFCSIPISKPPLNGSSDRSCRTLSSALPGLLLPLWIWWESFCPTGGCKSCIWQVCNPKDLRFGQGSNLKIQVFIRDQEIKSLLCANSRLQCAEERRHSVAFAISTTRYQ